MAGSSCDPLLVCRLPTNQIVNELYSWTQYGAWSAEVPAFAICATVGKMYVQINTGTWVDCSSITPVKLVSGVQGQGVSPHQCISGNCCNAGSAPRATWGLQAKAGSGGNTYSMRIKVIANLITLYSPTFTIQVNPAITEVEITKTLVYSVRPTIDLTKSLQYAIITLNGVTKSLVYAIVAPAPESTKQLVYSVITSSETAKGLEYAILTSDSIVKTLQYAVRTTVAPLEKQLTYAIRIYPYCPKNEVYTPKIRKLCV